MSILKKLLKRRSYPIRMGDVEITIRALTIGEILRMEVLPADQRTGFVIGCSLLETDGQPVFQQGVSTSGQILESDASFAVRVLDELRDIPTDSLGEIAAAIQRLGRPVDPETVRKNS